MKGLLNCWVNWVRHDLEPFGEFRHSNSQRRAPWMNGRRFVNAGRGAVLTSQSFVGIG